MQKAGEYQAIIFLDIDASVVRFYLNDEGDFQDVCICSPTRRGSAPENAQHIAKLLNEYEKTNAKPVVDKNQLVMKFDKEPLCD